jgi:hypothetical protein
VTWWQDKAHPIWPIIRILTVFVGLSGFLWLNASHFDGGEVKTIGGTVALAALAEAFGIRRGGGSTG